MIELRDRVNALYGNELIQMRFYLPRCSPQHFVPRVCPKYSALF
jgi:hypothetical protein